MSTRPAAACMLASLAPLALAACGRSSAAPPPVPGAEAQLAVTTADATAGVTVSPLPGTPDASSATQISFLGAPGMRVTDVRVVASQSGKHGGALRAYSTGTGQSFLPHEPFRAGERVSVSARLSVPGAVSRGGEIGTSFQVAQPAAVSKAEFPAEPGDARAVRHFASAPALDAPAVAISTRARSRTHAGDLFLAPYQGAGAHGPMIVDQRGGLVWLHPLPAGETATNFGVQDYLGRRVLAWWQGRVLALGFGEGAEVISDSSYRPLAAVRAGNGYQADLHVLRVTRAGTAWVDAFAPVRANLARYGGARDGVITDTLVQEIDVRTGLVMWEWHALGHIAVSESRTPPTPAGYPWDYAHVNSLDVGAHGDVLLTARNTWALYDVDIASGRVRWRLGGAHSSFSLSRGAAFYWQHDGEFQPGGLISLFDNGSEPPEERRSRGLVLRLDRARRTATLVRQFLDPARPLLSPSQGNAARLADGNWLLGYGRLPSFAEFDPYGHVLLRASLGRSVQDFKTLSFPWRGHPSTAPAIAVLRPSAASTAVAASWNGATDVASWRVLSGASPRELRPVASSPARGFETAIDVRAAGAYMAVQARDHAGAVLGSSAVVRG